MSRKNKSYLVELKYQAAGDYLSGGGSLRGICKKHGIRDKHTLIRIVKSSLCRIRKNSCYALSEKPHAILTLFS